MIKVLGIIAAGIVIFFWEGRLLLKRKKKKEMVILVLLLLLAMLINIGVALNFPIPSIAWMISKMLQPIVKPIEAWIQGGAA
jgi:membrane-associated HD superfamily phosphohydrolase